MPIKIPNDLPAARILENEHVFYMTEERALTQDIRPLKILILNLMPKKIETETQILRMLGNSPLQVDVELIQVKSHVSKNTPAEHIFKFYKTFDEVKGEKYDGMIITGAPVEHLEYEEVDYWQELCEIMQWSKTNVYSTFHICWGAQAALYYHYGIPKYPLPKKMFGVFPHVIHQRRHPLTRGFDEKFYVPHSRHTEIKVSDVEKVPELEVLSTSPISGFYLAASRDGRQVFVMGHSEYDRMTLSDEYYRDLEKGLPIEIPYHYFPEDNLQKAPLYLWRAHGNLLYRNWLNFFVYQRTPYNPQDIK